MIDGAHREDAAAHASRTETASTDRSIR
eukprot:COSAG01_NODE_44182_length_421_cov_6.453416_1_plen_27_part_01